MPLARDPIFLKWLYYEYKVLFPQLAYKGLVVQFLKRELAILRFKALGIYAVLNSLVYPFTAVGMKEKRRKLTNRSVVKKVYMFLSLDGIGTLVSSVGSAQSQFLFNFVFLREKQCMG